MKLGRSLDGLAFESSTQLQSFGRQLLQQCAVHLSYHSAVLWVHAVLGYEALAD